MKTLLLWAFVGLPLLLGAVFSAYFTHQILTDESQATGFLFLIGVPWILAIVTVAMIGFFISFLAWMLQRKGASIAKSRRLKR